MNRFTTKMTLAAMAVSAVLVCSFSGAQAGVRRGLLYDMFHFGGGHGAGETCDSCGANGTCEGCAPSCRLEAWIGSQIEAEKWRIREDVRFHHMHFYLHRQDKKKLLHPECPPFNDCYWGYYPTCWRVFPREPHCMNCPPAGGDSMYYEDAGPMNAPFEDWDPETDVPPGPADPHPDSESSDFPPPSLSETAPMSDEVPPEPAPAPYVE